VFDFIKYCVERALDVEGLECHFCGMRILSLLASSLLLVACAADADEPIESVPAVADNGVQIAHIKDKLCKCKVKECSDTVARTAGIPLAAAEEEMNKCMSKALVSAPR
jgi:hypothetical protein